MEVHRLKREFVYNGVKLPDTTPTMTPEQVRETYTHLYPEIATAASEGPETVAGKLVYKFVRAIGAMAGYVAWSCACTGHAVFNTKANTKLGNAMFLVSCSYGWRVLGARGGLRRITMFSTEIALDRVSLSTSESEILDVPKRCSLGGMAKIFDDRIVVAVEYGFQFKPVDPLPPANILRGNFACRCDRHRWDC